MEAGVWAGAVNQVYRSGSSPAVKGPPSPHLPSFSFDGPGDSKLPKSHKVIESHICC